MMMRYQENTYVNRRMRAVDFETSDVGVRTRLERERPVRKLTSAGRRFKPQMDRLGDS